MPLTPALTIPKFIVILIQYVKNGMYTPGTEVVQQLSTCYYKQSALVLNCNLVFTIIA
jgi:hypothetical protein